MRYFSVAVVLVEVHFLLERFYCHLTFVNQAQWAVHTRCHSLSNSFYRFIFLVKLLLNDILAFQHRGKILQTLYMILCAFFIQKQRYSLVLWLTWKLKCNSFDFSDCVCDLLLNENYNRWSSDHPELDTKIAFESWFWLVWKCAKFKNVLASCSQDNPMIFVLLILDNYFFGFRGYCFSDKKFTACFDFPKFGFFWKWWLRNGENSLF